MKLGGFKRSVRGKLAGGHLPCDPACTNWTAIAGGSVWLSAEGQPYVLKVAPQ